MKFQLIVMVLVFSCKYASSQDIAYSKLLEDAISNHSDCLTIYYIDSSLPFYEKFSRFAKGRKVEGFADLPESSKIRMTFTRSELKYIDLQMSKQYQVLWPEDLLEKSTRLSYDSLQRGPGNLQGAEGTSQNRCQYYYQFSQPVFARNNTIAIFRIAELINVSAGSDLVFIYVKYDEGWRRKMTIRAGAW